MPILIDMPIAAIKALGMELAICVNGAGPVWGGCELWASTDDITFAYIDTLHGGTVMGTLSATLGSGSDPDTSNTLSLDLSPAHATLLAGTAEDMDQFVTLC